VGAVFNRDYLDNRGWKPLPPTIHYSLKNTELYEVPQEVSAQPFDAAEASLIEPETILKRG